MKITGMQVTKVFIFAGMISCCLLLLINIFVGLDINTAPLLLIMVSGVSLYINITRNEQKKNQENNIQK